jgi:hypothetical protein
VVAIGEHGYFAVFFVARFAPLADFVIPAAASAARCPAGVPISFVSPPIFGAAGFCIFAVGLASSPRSRDSRDPIGRRAANGGERAAASCFLLATTLVVLLVLQN